MEILLDTNFLLYIAEYRLADNLEELYPKKIILPEQVLKEIEEIAEKRRGKLKKSAEIALLLIENWKKNKKLFVEKSKIKFADDAVIDLAGKKAAQKDAEKNDFFVATLDKNIIKSLKKDKIGIIKIRQKKYLILD